jgi:hypothetical protein
VTADFQSLAVLLAAVRAVRWWVVVVLMQDPCCRQLVRMHVSNTMHVCIADGEDACMHTRSAE